MSAFAQEVLASLRAVLGEGQQDLHHPWLDSTDEEVVAEAVRSGYVSSVGPSVANFEKELGRVTGARHVVATVNGTSALHLGLVVVGVKPLDEVVVPALSFVATANAVSHVGASPVFCDVDEDTLGLNPEVLLKWLKESLTRQGGEWVNRESGRRVAAVVPVHVFGHPCDSGRIAEICAEFGLVMVEDAAEALGTHLGGRHVGLSGDVGVLSFNGNKIVTTGGGGALLTNDEWFAGRARHLATTARVSHEWDFDHDEVGFNFRMPSVNASLGLNQLSRLEEMVASKRRLYHSYTQAFSGVEGLKVMGEPARARSNFWLQALVLTMATKQERDEILDLTNKAGIQTRPLWRPLNTLKPYVGCCSTPTPNALKMFEKIINIPSSSGIA